MQKEGVFWRLAPAGSAASPADGTGAGCPLNGHHQSHPAEAQSCIWTSVPCRLTSACQARLICQLMQIGTSFYKRKDLFGPQIVWNLCRSTAENSHLSERTV